MRKRVFSDFKGKWYKLFIPDMHSSYFADSSVFYIFGDLQDGFSFIIQFSTDMPPGIVISFIQVEYRMDVKLVIA